MVCLSGYPSKPRLVVTVLGCTSMVCLSGLTTPRAHACKYGKYAGLSPSSTHVRQ